MNIAWIIIILFLVFFVQGIVNKKWGLKGVKYHRYFERATVYEGEKIIMVDEIKNLKLLPIAWLRLETKMDANLLSKDSNAIEREGAVYHRTLFSLLPYQKITRRHQLIGRKRGYYPLQNVSVASGDAMGYGEVFETITAQASITIYP